MNAHVHEAKSIDGAALAQLFHDARTHNGFLDRPVSDELLKKAVDLAKIAPTSANQKGTPKRGPRKAASRQMPALPASSVPITPRSTCSLATSGPG